MPYFLLVLGLFLLVYGGYLLKKENNVRKEEFRELLNTQNTDNEEYIKLLAANQDLKIRLDSIENKFDQFLDHVESVHRNQLNRPDNYSIEHRSDYPTVDSTDYEEEVKNQAKVRNEELSTGLMDTESTEGADSTEGAEQTRASVNLGKGEVRFIQNLLEK